MKSAGLCFRFLSSSVLGYMGVRLDDDAIDFATYTITIELNSGIALVAISIV